MTELIPTIIGIIVVIVILIILMSGYVKASPDRAIIISGIKKEPRILNGRSGIKIPFLERKDELALTLIPVDVQTVEPVPTADFINIKVSAQVNVEISKDPERIKKAMQNFLNCKPQYIAQVANQVLEGSIREIVGKMNLRDMVTNRNLFDEKVKEFAAPDFANMGLDIVSFNVKDFMDDQRVIENLGVNNVAQISKDAAIAKANADKEVAIAQAAANKAANDAKVDSDFQIAQKNNELAIKQAELKKNADIQKAIADAAYEIQKQEQQKTINTTTADANIIQQEKEAVIKQREADVAEQTLKATTVKKAEADKQAAQQKADAELYTRTKEAEAKTAEATQQAEQTKVAAAAELFRQQQAAEAIKASAEAELFRQQKTAEAIRANGQASADAIRAKGLAEAEAIDKKAEAMKKYGQAAMVQMIVEKLPDMAKAVAEPLSKIGNIDIIDSGSGQGGAGNVGGYVPAALAQTIKAVKAATGFDLEEVMKAETYDAKVTKNININGVDSGDNADESTTAAATVIAETVADEVKSSTKESKSK